MTAKLDIMPPAEIERILRPVYCASLEFLGATKAPYIDFTMQGAEIITLKREDLEALSRLYMHFCPSARYGELLVKGIASEQDRPPNKSLWQRVIESRWAWTYYYALGFWGGFAAADLLH